MTTRRERAVCAAVKHRLLIDLDMERRDKERAISMGDLRAMLEHAYTQGREDGREAVLRVGVSE